MEKELKVSREKHWIELADSEKIERLRQVVKDQERVLVKMATYIDNLVDHNHFEGEIVRRIPHPNSESYGSIYYRKPIRTDDWF